MYNTNTGSENTGHGVSSLFYNTAGSYNTAIGLGSLYTATGSSNNTSLGCRAGAYYNFGWNNTLVGANSDANTNGLFNAIAIGESSQVTGSNQAGIGNSSISSIGGYANWTNISDGRVKKNIAHNVPGLIFINQLNPITYNLDLDVVDNILGVKPKRDNEGKIIPVAAFETAARKQKEKIVYSGFIAQNVEMIARQIGYNFSGVDADRSSKDLYGLRYAEFVVPLVKAVQELSQENEELKNQSAIQMKEMEKLVKRMEKLEGLVGRN